MGISRERGDEVAHFVQGSLSIRSLELQTQDSLTLLLMDKLRIAGGPKMGMSRERSDEVAHFVQGSLLRSPELQTQDSLSLWLTDKLRIAGGVR